MKLPLELMHMVVKNVSKDELKALRLISQVLHPAATQLLFCRVYASPHLKDLEVLSAISSHPAIRLAVREVVYVGVYYHHSHNMVWKYVRDSASGPTRETTPEERSIGRDYSIQRFIEQNYLRETGEDIAIMSLALSRMPNARQVTLRNYGNDEVPSFKTIHPFAKPPFVRYAPIPRNMEDFDYGLQAICKAISISGAKIETFSVDHERGFSGISPTSFLGQPRDIQHYCNAFQHIRKLSFVIHHLSDHRRKLAKTKLAEILASATNLEELEFAMPSQRSSEWTRGIDPIPLTRIFATHTWPRLRCLTLKDMFPSCDDLVELLKRHLGTLERLVLQGLVLLDGTWEDVVNKLKGTEKPALVSVECKGRFYNYSDVEVTIKTEELEKGILGVEHGEICRKPTFRF